MHAEANDSYRREMLMSAAAMKVQPIGQNISIRQLERISCGEWRKSLSLQGGIWLGCDPRRIPDLVNSQHHHHHLLREVGEPSVCVSATRKKGRVRARILLASLSFWSPRGQFMQSALMARQTVASTRALGARWPAAGRACSSVPLFRRTHELPGVVMMRVITASRAAIGGTMLVLIRSIACYITW